MILSNLQNSERIEGLHPLFKMLFDYVKTHDLLNAPLGRIELDGDKLFINNVELNGIAADKQVLEYHKEYLDVHILLAGEETIGWKPTGDIKEISQPYNKEKDCALSPEKAQDYIALKPGDFMIVYPEDAHAPTIGEGKIRKLIGKVKL